MLRAKAAESAAPTRVRWVEPHNNAASHWHEADDVTVGATPSPNANTAPDEQHIDRHSTLSLANRCDRHVADQTRRSVPKHGTSTRPVARARQSLLRG